MTRVPPLVSFAFALLVVAAVSAQAPGPAPRPDGGPVRAPAEQPAAGAPAPAAAPGNALGHDATLRISFADTMRAASVLDAPSRDAWQKPAEVVAALGVRPGDVVADVGAGTGYFERHLAAAVGEAGAVFAVEVELTLVEHLRERAEIEGTERVIPVLGSRDDPRLPPGRVNVVLLVATVHYLDDRPAWFRRLRRALAPGGRVAIIDFTSAARPVGPPLDLVLPPEHVAAEMREAGFELESKLDFLPWQYGLVFRLADGD